MPNFLYDNVMQKSHLVLKKLLPSPPSPPIMGANMAKSVKLSARVDEALDQRINEAIARRRLGKEKWLIEAYLEKLDREGMGNGEIGPFAGLDSTNRKRAERFIRFLRAAPPFLLEASDAAQAQLEAILREWRRSGKW